ncbi:6-aminohexanoate hydrolase [Aminobacter sp. Y103A]|jgi:CubicO group peptidase (beta-lactamase class C family)|uniref:serine hydrolase domain-containing protein n=1 Tax=unclassified Aminobacter TaxID=2644704 RepID=UPI0012B139A0|nr:MULTISPECIES: serine hydrolase [unclassified Aminobacter]MRX35675.1 serine hydrolase [Aminobacter sp. MDW-2]QNH36448.1 serine hydrolase [Aminobacter sp. MDW-2]BBD39326.1 6-aminohexanoate hydrolase [Aminobacter sp. SS-2016]
MTSSNAFEQAFGFARQAVTLGNWREKPFNRWAFQNVGEMVRSTRIPALEGKVESAPVDLAGLLTEIVDINGRNESVAGFLERSSTDALAVMKKGRFVGDWFAPEMRPEARHIIFSISKSLTAVLAGSLEGEGKLDPNAPVTDYVPEATGSVYAKATVRHVLDMTVSLDFEEAYLDPESAFARYRRATMWNPGGGSETLREFLVSLQPLDEPHGQTFRYRSPNSDLLGIIVERASGQRYAELMADKLWQPLGAVRDAFVSVDSEGSARAAGGVSVAVRDLARVGEMMRQGGVAEGGRIVPQAWVEDTIHGGDAVAWQRGTMTNLFAHGRYRNKWYQSANAAQAYCGIGIHGQWLYIDPKAEVVISKMSSQALPVDDPLDLDNVAFFEAMCARV